MELIVQPAARLADMGKAMAGVALMMTAAGWGQTAAPPAFEVASVRRAQSENRHGLFDDIRVTPGSLTMRALRFRAAVAWAYGVKDLQVTGPGWMDQSGFDIIAKASGAATAEEMRPMLRTLLAERFQLEAHTERKETPAWVLTVGKNGLSEAVQPSREDGDIAIQPDPSKMQVTIRRGGTAQVVSILERVFREPVVDETGLNGKYDLTVNLSNYLSDGTGPPDVPSIAVRAIQDMGLKLEHRKVSMDFVTVDRAMKEPVEN
jgi:uncharacterized protein (TIGR03435 family)